LTDEETARLQGMGHKLEQGNRLWGNMEVITWDFASGKVAAASDPRGEGEGLVY
jgi:gamma-glutamyltranspeptidase/glutathione hydrolase